MSLLQCSNCSKPMSATSKSCPHCGQKISLLKDLKRTIESSRIYPIMIIVLLLFMLGWAWSIKSVTGNRLAFYSVLICCGFFVPWILKMVYKTASDAEKEANQDEVNNSDATTPKGKVLQPFSYKSNIKD